MAYTDASSLKSYLGLTSSGDDTLLGNLISRAQSIIDATTQRTFEASGNTTRYFNPDTDVDHKTRRILYLGHNDLCQIATVTNGDGTVISASDYVTHPVNYTPYYAIQLKLSSSDVWTYSDAPESAIAISGRWAYSVTAPADIQHATIRLASWLYRQRDSGNGGNDAATIATAGVVISPAALPSDVQLILQPYKRYV